MKKFLPIVTLLLFSGLSFAQTGTNTAPSSPDSSMNTETETMESTTTRKKKEERNMQTPSEQQQMEDSTMRPSEPSSGTTTTPSSETNSQRNQPSGSPTAP